MKKTKNFIPVAFPDLSGNEKKYLNRVLSSSWISSKGEFIDKFEADFARFTGSRFAVSTVNGTAALHLALASLKIGPGDEVIVPDLTFVASVNAVKFTGATPVLADIDRKSFSISVDQIEKLISKKTKAILPVHLYGIPANMGNIMAISKKYNLRVVEDSAEAHGARVKVENNWKKVGSIGDAGCFSFYGNKIITTGEGGMVVTNSPVLADKMRILKDHGQDTHRQYFHSQIGFNYRMTNLQAAIGVAQLERMNQFLLFREKIADFYRKYLKNVPGIFFPYTDYQAKPVCWLFSIVLAKTFRLTRDELIKKLADFGIESRPFFIPISRLPPYLTKKSYPVSEYVSKGGLSLPSGYNINERKIQFICSIIRNYSN